MPLDCEGDIYKKRAREGFARLAYNTGWKKKKKSSSIFQYCQRISVWLSWKLKPQFLHIQETLFVWLLRWTTEHGVCAQWHFNKNETACWTRYSTTNFSVSYIYQSLNLLNLQLSKLQLVFSKNHFSRCPGTTLWTFGPKIVAAL